MFCDRTRIINYVGINKNGNRQNVVPSRKTIFGSSIVGLSQIIHSSLNVNTRLPNTLTLSRSNCCNLRHEAWPTWMTPHSGHSQVAAHARRAADDLPWPFLRSMVTTAWRPSSKKVSSAVSPPKSFNACPIGLPDDGVIV